MKTVDRRLELLKMEGIGVSPSDIKKQLSEKYQVSIRAVQYDFEQRCKWQPSLTQLKDNDKILQKILNRQEQLYKKYAFMYLISDNDNVKLGALNGMRAVNKDQLETTVIPELMARLLVIEEKAREATRL